MGEEPESFTDVQSQRKTSRREKTERWRTASHHESLNLQNSANTSTELQLLQNQLENAEQSLQRSQDRHLQTQRRHREESARYMDCSIQLQKLADQGATFVSSLDYRCCHFQADDIADQVLRIT
jgi:fumarylacetoacetate (FAA) hydrolase family protein